MPETSQECKFCDAEVRCFAHCNKSETGVHVPDWPGLSFSQDGERVYIDVPCSLCGNSGTAFSSSIEGLREEIQWA